MKKEMSMRSLLIFLSLPMAIALLWDIVPQIKNSAHFILNPTAGFLLEWDLTYGMIVIVFVLSLFTILIQKYATDQQTLKEIKKEQKILQEEMKKFREHPEKLAELQKKQFQFIPKTMMISMRAIAFTGVPIILFFRWFSDFFTELGNPVFLGFMSWFWFYFIGFLIFSSIFRKILDVA
ncbi:MAG: EMC3/TMCO1 family protein [archaeon]